MVIDDESKSLRKKVFELWVENPYLVAQQICRKLKKTPREANLLYKTHGNYINKLLSEFRSYHKLGSPQKAQELPHRREFRWEFVSRELFPGRNRERALKFWGWCEVKNRNGMWIFRDDRGSVEWYKGGLVRLFVKGTVQLAKVKELFCRAFRFLPEPLLFKFVDAPIEERLRHWVFDVGAPLPRFDIRKFEKSHGLRIFTDGSHPTAVEIAETQPFWIGELRKTVTGLSDTIVGLDGTINKLGCEIDEHMKLIRTWEKGATTWLKEAERRRTRERLVKKRGRFLKKSAKRFSRL